MLQKLNEGIKGWVATVVVVAISVSFLIFGISYYLNSRSSSTALVAKVGATAITNSEVQTLFRREQYVQEQTEGVLSQQQSQYLKQLILDALIQQAVRAEALKKLGLRAPRVVVQEAIQGLPAFQRDGRYDPILLREQLANNGITLDQLMQQVSDQLIAQQLTIGIQMSTPVFPESVQSMANWALQTRSFRYVNIPANLFVASAKISEADLEAYYSANQKAFSTPDRVQMSYVRLNPAVLAKSIVVSPADIEAYYQSNNSQFRSPAVYRYADVVVLKPSSSADQAKRQQSIDAINALLRSGRSLQTIANQFGGSIRSSQANELNPAIFSLLQTMQPGQVLAEKPVDSGTLWLQLISVKPGSVKPLSAVQSEIKALLVNQRVAAKLASMTETLTDMTYTESSSLEPAAKALNLPIIESDWIDKAGAKTGIFSDKKLINAAFSDEVLKQGNNSMPITLADGSVVVLRVKGFQKVQVRPFKTVKAQVEQYVRLQAAQLQAALFAGKLQQALETNAPVTALLAAYHLNWKSLSHVSRTDKAAPQALLEAAFAIEKAPAVTTFVSEGATTVIQLNAIELSQSSLTEAQKTEFAQAVRNFYASIDEAAVLTTVEKTIPVKRFPDRLL
jgi:peptidyl-prolyl cis-trans isomerase D